MKYFIHKERKNLSVFFSFFFLILFNSAVYPLPAYSHDSNILEGFGDLVEQLLPAVVNISATQRISTNQRQNRGSQAPAFPPGSPFEDLFRHFFENKRGRPAPRTISSRGSGFIIDAQKGLVVTNYHVIKEADQISVILQNDQTLVATVLSSDEKTDITVLKVETDQKLTEVNFGDSDEVRVGDWVLAIGNPYGFGGTVTVGIVSARAREVNNTGPYTDFIQTDASINPGNSGGPMFNLKGEVIGINTAIYSRDGGSVGIGFAIPSSLAKEVIDQLIEHGRTRRGWLGVAIQTVTREIAEEFSLSEPKGALITNVNTRGPASIAGLRAGDIILEFNHIKIPNMRKLPRIVAQTSIGSRVPVVVWRDGNTQTFYVTLGELEEAERQGYLNNPGPKQDEPTDPSSFQGLGLTLSEITPELQRQYSLQSTTGLIITNIERNTEAARKNLEIGDRVMEFNHTKISTIQDFIEQFENVQNSQKSTVLLRIEKRNNSTRFLALSMNNSRR